MKIAVFHNLPSGGAKRALYNFVKYLSKSGHHVVVLVPDTANESFLPLKELAGKVEIFPVRKTLLGMAKSTLFYVPLLRCSLADIDKTQREIAVAINRVDYDVVFSEQDQYTMSPFLLKYIKKPTVYYCPQPQRTDEAILQRVSLKIQGADLPTKLKRVLSNYLSNRMLKIDKQNARFATYILTNSYFSRESILRSYGLNSFVCYLGVDTEVFTPVNVSKGDYVLTVGACYPAKGHDFIVQSLARVRENRRPRLVIVSNSGDAVWQNYLEQLALRNRVQLEVKTLIADREIVELYNGARLFVYAPYLEPFGLAPLEAMACGTPVVAVKEGGVRESVLHNQTGILTERDEEKFAEAIVEIYCNEQAAVQMGRKAIEVVRSFWTVEHAGRRLIWHLERARSLYPRITER